MGTGGKPGVTIKTKVLAITEDTLTVSLKEHETGYFQLGHDYVAQFIPTPASGDSGDDSDEGNPT